MSVTFSASSNLCAEGQQLTRNVEHTHKLRQYRGLHELEGVETQQSMASIRPTVHSSNIVRFTVVNHVGHYLQPVPLSRNVLWCDAMQQLLSKG